MSFSGGTFWLDQHFSMDLSTLTNAKTILSLGPNKSILLDDEEEPLPRGNGIRNDRSTPSSSGKKRKAPSKEEKVANKVRENRESGKIRHEESDSRKDKGKKKKCWRHDRDGSHSDGFRGYVVCSPQGWTS
ncbi:hypothetical protein Acr_00g0034980 [Actinidia rufa]|uniref:Uncharacterized protein n=1 Tax=Actinidia rufa TaxID=165716 RepID=A0A7J0DGM2_9ERIC|nr:hypothetical protein Acr_00g0034980 [Actinidia rufa]